MFFNKKIYRDSVDLTIGVVYIKPLDNKVVNKAMIRSTIVGDLINNALFFHLIEQELVVLKKKEWNNLTVKDGEKVRNKIKEILSRHGLLEEKQEQKTAKKEFNDEEIAFFKRTEGIGMLRGEK